MKNILFSLPFLSSRLLLFAFFQFCIFLIFSLTGHGEAWTESQGWWTFSAFFTNLVSILLLSIYLPREGKKYRDVFRFSKISLKKDLWIFLILFLLMGPVAMLPNHFLSIWFWGDTAYSAGLLFRPLPAWAVWAGFAFPLTIGFAELPTYYGWLMPRLISKGVNPWLAVSVCALFLALQHISLPLIFDARYLLYRFLMFLPFAFFIGISVKIRPSLLPWFIVVHVIMDTGTVLMFFL